MFVVNETCAFFGADRQVFCLLPIYSAIVGYIPPLPYILAACSRCYKSFKGFNILLTA